MLNDDSDTRYAVNVQAIVRLLRPLDGVDPDPVEKKRRLIANILRMIGEQVNGTQAPPAAVVARRMSVLQSDVRHLSPRLQQTLAALLSGDSEKQAAVRMGVSPHTVHVYVKALYRRYNVSSRAELLAKWVSR